MALIHYGPPSAEWKRNELRPNKNEISGVYGVLMQLHAVYATSMAVNVPCDASCPVDDPTLCLEAWAHAKGRPKVAQASADLCSGKGSQRAKNASSGTPRDSQVAMAAPAAPNERSKSFRRAYVYLFV